LLITYDIHSDEGSYFYTEADMEFPGYQRLFTPVQVTEILTPILTTPNFNMTLISPTTASKNTTSNNHHNNFDDEEKEEVEEEKEAKVGEAKEDFLSIQHPTNSHTHFITSAEGNLYENDNVYQQTTTFSTVLSPKSGSPIRSYSSSQLQENTVLQQELQSLKLQLVQMEQNHKADLDKILTLLQQKNNN
jgi:hypothetical protein